MPHEDKNLTCAQCGKEFTFTVGEQDFFAQKNLGSPPKRCKECRKIKRGQVQPNDGIYRAPAFNDSAPAHQKMGKRGDSRRRGDQEYRSPAFHGLDQRGSNDYRSPAFREQEKLKPDQEYRSPAFREYEKIKPEEEYRSPAFREHADIDVKSEYRAVAYQDLKDKYRDEKPMFHIVCPACGQDAMVPFLPEEKDEPLCAECYKAHRHALAEEARLIQAEERRQEEVAAGPKNDTPSPAETPRDDSEPDGAL